MPSGDMFERDNKGKSQELSVSSNFFKPSPPQSLSGKTEPEYFFLSEEAGQTIFKLGWAGRCPVSV